MAFDPTPTTGVRRGLSRNVIVLAVVSFFADASSELAYPLIPLFLTGTLGAPATAVGLIEGVAEATAAGLRLFAGWLSDRMGKRRPLVIAGYGLAAAGKLLLALSFVWPQVLLARVVDRLGKGIRGAPRDALIADSTEAPFRGRAFGFHRSADTIGAVVGPLAALALVTVGLELRWIFAVAVLPGIASVFVARIAREVPSTKPARARPSLWVGGRRFRVFLAIMAIFAVGNSSDIFLLLRAADAGLGQREVVLAYVVYNLVYALASLPLGSLSDRLGRLPVLVGGMLVFAGVYLGFGVIDAGRWVWALFALYGLYIAATDGVARALIVDLVPAERRAQAIGAHGALMAAFVLLASVIAGVLWDTVSSAAPFFVGAGTATIAAILLATVLAKTKEVGQIPA